MPSHVIESSALGLPLLSVWTHRAEELSYRGHHNPLQLTQHGHLCFTELIASGLGFALSVHDGRSPRSLGCSILLLILKKGGGVSKVLDAAAK